MTETVSTKNKFSENLIFALICAALVTTFLFFIDEGYYNFNWMLNFSSWIVFVIYTVALTPLQLLFASVLLNRKSHNIKGIFLPMIGALVTFLLFLFLALLLP